MRRAVEVVHTAVKLAAGWKIGLIVAAVLLALLLFLGLAMAAIGASGGSGAGGEGALCSVTGKGNADIPPEYVPWLQKAATQYKLGPRGYSIVAAVHKIESDFGRSTLPGVHSGTNYAGAAGPGQFLLGTWTFYGVDADGNGLRDIYSVPDSVFATANYLRASGAPGDWRAALFAYNHADWYVEEVLKTAQQYSAAEVCQPFASSELGELPAGPLARIEYVARWIEAQHVHYCWGGGHAAKPGPSGGEYCWSADGQKVYGASERGLDCSGAVRWLLVLYGYRDTGPLDSGGFAHAYPSGPGRYVTIWSNLGHVFVTINGRDWGTSSSNFAHGPGFGGQSHAGFVASHPPGL